MTQNTDDVHTFERPSEATADQKYAMDRVLAEVVDRSHMIFEACEEAKDKAAAAQPGLSEHERAIYAHAWRAATISLATSLLIVFDKLVADVTGAERRMDEIIADLLTRGTNITVELVGVQGKEEQS